MNRIEKNDPPIVLTSRPRRQFRLRTLFLLQALVALLLSFFLVAGWFGLLGIVGAVVTGTLLGSCFEMIRHGSPQGFLPRKWETRGALVGGVAAVCGAWGHPEAAAEVAMIALIISSFLFWSVYVTERW